jgi:hypothetical protein
MVLCTWNKCSEEWRCQKKKEGMLSAWKLEISWDKRCDEIVIDVENAASRVFHVVTTHFFRNLKEENCGVAEMLNVYEVLRCKMSPEISFLDHVPTFSQQA